MSKKETLNDQFRIVAKMAQAARVSFPTSSNRMIARHVLSEINRSWYTRFTAGIWDEQRILALMEYDFR